MKNDKQNAHELHNLLPDANEADINLDDVSPKSHPLWNLALSLAPILNPEMELTKENVESLLPALENYSKNLDLHFRDENRARVALYSQLATRYATLAGRYQEPPNQSVSADYLKMSIAAHKAANQAAKDSQKLYNNLADYSHVKFTEKVFDD
jgi:uncharacterized protein YdiU (UPF0061 family)